MGKTYTFLGEPVVGSALHAALEAQGHTYVDACADADVVFTDTWTSMGDEAEHDARVAAFQGFCVTPELMAHAAPDALFMHCLPAHRGEEVVPAVIDGPQSVIYDEAGNRLHAQKAVMSLLMGVPAPGAAVERVLRER